MLNVDRMITTDMSANIVADLLKRGITPQEMARAIRAEANFIKGIQAKKHTFTQQDITSLAKLGEITPKLLLFNSMRPVHSDMKQLFDAVRQQLETSARYDARFNRKPERKRRPRTKAA
jgi:hypothetical protein